MLMLLSMHVTSVLFLVRFKYFTLTMGFYWSYTLLLQWPILLRSWSAYTLINGCYMECMSHNLSYINWAEPERATHQQLQRRILHKLQTCGRPMIRESQRHGGRGREGKGESSPTKRKQPVHMLFVLKSMQQSFHSDRHYSPPPSSTQVDINGIHTKN